MAVAPPPFKGPTVGQDTTHDAIAYHAVQHVIPRYWDRHNHPAGKIVGCGPETKLIGTAGTQNLSNKCIVTNEGYGDGHTLAQFGSSPPAVCQPRLRKLCVVGYDDAGTGYDGTGVVKLFPAANNTLTTNLYDAIKLDGGGGIIEDVEVSHIPGRALYLTRPPAGSITKWGDVQRLRWLVNRLTSYNCFAGPHIDVTDGSVNDCETVNFRDWGFRFGTQFSTGAIQFDQCHAFAGGWEGAYGGGAAILIDGDGCHGTKSYGESAPIGICFNGRYCTFGSGFESINCPNANVRFMLGSNLLYAGNINIGFEDFGLGGHPIVCKRTAPSGFATNGDCIGAEIWDQFCTIRDVNFRFLSLNTGGIGICINQDNSGNHVVVENSLFIAPGGTSDTGPIGFAVRGSCPGINNSTITGHCVGGNIGWDFSKNGCIGVGNLIRVTYEASPRIPFAFPANQTWANATIDQSKLSTDPNMVLINGARWCKQ